jgi:formate dehydrogenase subunit delta
MGSRSLPKYIGSPHGRRATSHDKLGHRANQIGRFFQSQKPETVVAAIEEHLLKFWDPRIRRAIVSQLAERRVHLDPLVRQAVEPMGGG